MFKLTRSKLLLSCALSALLSYASAQSGNNSPYSRIGLGDFYAPDLTTAIGMGGVSGFYNSAYGLNAGNPASLGSLHYTAYELGGYYRHGKMTEGTNSAVNNDGGLSYLVLGFPINHSWSNYADTADTKQKIQWGMSFGLMPHSGVNYSVSVRDSSNTQIGPVDNIYQGKGTHYEVAWSNGIRYKNLSLGLKVAYLFGKTTRSTIDYFRDSQHSNGFYTYIFNNQNLNGVLWNLGAQYQVYLSKQRPDEDSIQYNKRQKTKLMFGLNGNYGLDIHVRDLSETERRSNIYGTDTVYSSTQIGYWKKWPSSVSFSMGYGKENAWQAGLQFDYTTWNVFTLDASSQANGSYYANTWRLGAGFEWAPDMVSDGDVSYIKRMTYRAGLFYGLDPRVVTSGNGTEDIQLRKYGFTAGICFPIMPRAPRRIPSFVNVAFEMGKFGHPDFIEETYYRVTLGFTLNDSGWFRAPKFH